MKILSIRCKNSQRWIILTGNIRTDVLVWHVDEKQHWQKCYYTVCSCTVWATAVSLLLKSLKTVAACDRMWHYVNVIRKNLNTVSPSSLLQSSSTHPGLGRCRWGCVGRHEEQRWSVLEHSVERGRSLI